MSDTEPTVTQSQAETQGVRVSVRARYSAEHSAPEQGRYFFLYTIEIANRGEVQVQLLNRHWIITDGTGRTEEVYGPGVVGEQPVLGPGQAFEYTSGCPLSTPSGSMQGRYEMQREDGTPFDAAIARFELADGRLLH